MRLIPFKSLTYWNKWWFSTFIVVSILTNCKSPDEPIAESDSLSQKASLSPRRIKLKSNKVVDTATYTIDQTTEERVLAIAERVKKTNWAFNKVSLGPTGTPLSLSEFFFYKILYFDFVFTFFHLFWK
jgi:hypothetical protein